MLQEAIWRRKTLSLSLQVLTKWSVRHQAITKNKFVRFESWHKLFHAANSIRTYHLQNFSILFKLQCKVCLNNLEYHTCIIWRIFALSSVSPYHFTGEWWQSQLIEVHVIARLYAGIYIFVAVLFHQTCFCHLMNIVSQFYLSYQYSQST